MRRLRYLWLALLVGAIWLGGYFLEQNLNQYVLRVVINCGIACILALSLNLINGCAGQFSLGHAGFMGIGAYTSAALTTVSGLAFFQTPMGIGTSVVVGGVMAGIAGYLVGLPSLRLKGDYLAIVTLGFGEIIRIVFLNIDAIGGARGLPGIPRESNFFWVFLWASLTFICLFSLIRSSFGRAILAVREDEIAAEAMGIHVSHYKIVAFVISSLFAGIAGALFAHYQGFIDPNTFNFNRSVEAVIMVVIGGMGSFSGALIGAVIVTVLPELLRVFETYRMVIFPALLILTMMVRPMGLLGRKEIWDWLKPKKKAQPGRRAKVGKVEYVT
ncbi:MAG: branched-chain amino acid ABC transporter permease [Deltaproteobacteria bacterium]|nr:branched-chain amino acid ABC transporter permease [Deltaproteobacteria bacterium]